MPSRFRERHPLTRRRREPLTGDEVGRLEAACQTFRERLIVFTLLDTGLRLAELVGLKVDAVDWQAHTVAIIGKGHRRRVVPMSPRVTGLLEAVLATGAGLRMSRRTIQRELRVVANRAHIARLVSPHILRHTFACRALQKGVSLHALQQLLGHSDLATTAVYLNLSNEEAIREYRDKW